MGKNLHLIAIFTVLLNLLLSTSTYGKGEKNVMEQSSPVMAQNEEEESCSEDDEEDSITDRMIFLSGYISDGTANTVISQLLELDGENPDQDIYLYISSPGGSVYAGMAIYDAMQSVQADVVTVSMGLSASMAAILLAAGTPGKRFAFPHARVMIHQPFSFAMGNPEDIEIEARESTYLMNLLNSLLAFHTGQSITAIRRDTERDNYMSAMEAQNYGIIDRVIEQHPMVRSQ
ncbi:ATP-dependent Clp protease proteolytic subunit [Spirulina sp. CCNP1310]|uniref:ATP-dependent Clp protease proteolytic subunit n=1 Tax=Spirulina sp. CCNP1310 TaxID=3110249 RepID=UPI002B1F9163|nr:ATP-dependent Clp protease proteolytic subunit [Spirulina sp. CCNP1310]MEA5418883.1 ATP-dependent Clp protease proteolytic subunit [Spirulina sp. CCNP1310]